MASRPLQQTRRQSQRTSTSDEQQQRSSSNSRSTTSVDSQTVYLNDPKPSSSSSPNADPLQEQASSLPRRPIPGEDDEEPRKCWICFSDETEDTPDSTPWRSPCPCALTAHEGCLLDWIADMESPGATRSTAAPAEIKCPQCKAPIHLARPRSYVVEAFSAVESFTGTMLLPGIMTGLGYVVLLGASHHGAHTVRMIFGTDDADAILAPVRKWTWLEQDAVRYFPTVAIPILRGWRGLRVELGLPLIPAALVASRTSIADAVLPVLPIVFFATHPEASKSLTVSYWPPSAALAFVILPYIRSAYDEYMERVWGARERRWLKEIKPRQGREDAEAGAANDDAEEEEVIEIEVGFEALDLDEENEDNEPPPLEPVPAVAPPLNAPPTDMAQPEPGAANDNLGRADIEAAAAAAGGAQGQPQQQPQNAQPAPQGPHIAAHAAARGGTEIFTIAQRAGSSVLGALLFPTAAAASGEILQLLLPLSWTAVHYGPRGKVLPPTGLLQTRWGRSVVGGCLFVVLKDAIRVYCRWRMARSFRGRRVREWDKRKEMLVD